MGAGVGQGLKTKQGLLMPNAERQLKREILRAQVGRNPIQSITVAEINRNHSRKRGGRGKGQTPRCTTPGAKDREIRAREHPKGPKPRPCVYNKDFVVGNTGRVSTEEGTGARGIQGHARRYISLKVISIVQVIRANLKF